MQIVIDIPKEKYDVIQSDLYNTFPAEMKEWGLEAIKNGKPLDKIRAEIEQKCCITVGRENDPAITLYDLFHIIDKYRAESEEES